MARIPNIIAGVLILLAWGTGHRLLHGEAIDWGKFVLLAIGVPILAGAALLYGWFLQGKRGEEENRRLGILGVIVVLALIAAGVLLLLAAVLELAILRNYDRGLPILMLAIIWPAYAAFCLVVSLFGPIRSDRRPAMG